MQAQVREAPTSIRFEQSLLAQLNETRDNLGMSRNAIVNQAVEIYLSQLKTPSPN
ncbi:MULTISPECIES: hypothetical protein [Leptolyngbya]|uniref:hypothetical protein n=1 Tax=Leptolyngbya TaxID=47251 RepID=UPI001684CD99|nr:hypothetical protein [Leptolyngbya sp. FACHB-1624]MBD1857442.1 hypothetical protein [Leptolyngbya sp. FACHB-1624]